MSGNVEFPATVDIVVQENTKANMKKMRGRHRLSKPGAPPPPNIFKENKARACRSARSRIR